MNQRKVSVVIPGYNCQKTIKSCLEAVIDQSYPVGEIVFVDDGSTDNTASIVGEMSAQVKYEHQPNAGPASARNHGARVSTGDVIFFTDSDCVAEKDWVEKAVGCFEDEQIGCVAGSYGIANPDSMLARCIYGEIQFRHTHLMPRYPKAFGSYNFAIKRDLFIQLGGFNENYRFASGEDNDLSYRLLKKGLKIQFEPSSKVKHHHPEVLIRYLSEQYRHGFWRVRMYIDHPNMMAGDDYTFWKDILEVPTVCLLAAALVLSLLYVQLGWLVVALAVFLAVMQTVVALKAVKNNSERILLIFTTFFRAFARTFGFSSGIIYFFLNKNPKKVK